MPSKDQQRGHDPTVDRTRGATPAIILVVDDEDGIRLLLEAVLADEGFRVLTAHDGIEALRLAEVAEPPDLVVTDLMMPRLDGYGLIARLRAAAVPLRGIIAMSAAGLAGPRPVGADLFIAKPFDIEYLVASVVALLGEASGPALHL